MLLDFLRTGDMQLVITGLFISTFVVLAILPIHECAHAFVAHLLGDDTARLSGRMTLNPIVHIDPIGALMIFLVGFGWAKGVPVNIRNFKNRKLYMGLTALAGPVSNLLIAFAFMAFFKLLIVFKISMPERLAYAVPLAFNYMIYINIALAVFNLIPIPPLDGSRVFTMFLPDRLYYTIMDYERYSFIILLVLVATGALSKIIGILAGFFMGFFSFILQLSPWF